MFITTEKMKKIMED